MFCDFFAVLDKAEIVLCVSRMVSKWNEGRQECHVMFHLLETNMG